MTAISINIYYVVILLLLLSSCDCSCTILSLLIPVLLHIAAVFSDTPQDTPFPCVLDLFAILALQKNKKKEERKKFTMAYHGNGGNSPINYENAGHRLEDLPSYVSPLSKPAQTERRG